MIVFFNGELVEEKQARISIFDRGFLFGDGLFETLRVENGLPFRWAQHWARFKAGADRLRLRIPHSEDDLRQLVTRLISANNKSTCMLRITLSRGVGARGYSPKGADQPTLVMSIHEAPRLESTSLNRWALFAANVRLATDEPLAQFKTSNKLAQVLARAESDDAGADEALLCNADGWVLEGASSNLFWIKGGRVYTPPLGSGILSGVTRAIILELCQRDGIPTHESQITLPALRDTDGVFLTVTSLGVVEGSTLNNSALPEAPLTRLLHERYVALLASES